MTPVKSSILIVCGIILTILLALTHPTAIEGFAYNIFAPGMVMTTAGIFLLFQSLSDSFETISSRAKIVLQMISTASFGVYLTHELINQFVRYILILTHQTLLLNTDLLTDYLRAFIIFSLATLITYAIQQLPLLKKIVP
jgi:surface polysaccharide O-acyltransferase-like enzyme